MPQISLFVDKILENLEGTSRLTKTFEEAISLNLKNDLFVVYFMPTNIHAKKILP